MQTYELRFPTDAVAAGAQAMLADRVAVANGTMRVTPGFCYGLAYLVVHLPDDADPVDALSPFITDHWQIPGLRWQVELDKRVMDEEVELTAQDIADEAQFDIYWRFFPDKLGDLSEAELWSRIDAARGEED